MLCSSCPTYRRSPENRSANENRTSAKRKCLGDVSPASDAAVEHDRQPTIDCKHNILEDLDRANRAINVAAAMV